MSASSVDLPTAPPPPIARPAGWPLAVAALVALAVPLWQKFDAAGWLGGGAVAGAFLAARRSGVWVGLLAALAVAAVWIIYHPAHALAQAGFLAAICAWFAVRFRDDPAPVNGLVAGIAGCALALVHRYGALGAVLAVGVISWRLRPLARVWPVAFGIVLGWLVAQALPWF